MVISLSIGVDLTIFKIQMIKGDIKLSIKSDIDTGFLNQNEFVFNFA